VTRHKNVLCILFGVLAMLAVAPLAQAEATRTWVSGVGDDANPCSRTAPCKTFAGAISKTAAGGEISVLDPGGFGAVTITKSITINGAGTLAGILSAGTNGIIVNAATPSTDVIHLRHLYINGAGTGLAGISYLAAKAVYLDDVHIYGNTGPGIKLLNAAGKLVVTNSSVSSSASGLNINEGTGLVGRAAVSNSNFTLNNFGVVSAGATTRMTLQNVQISDSINAGMLASQGGFAQLESSLIQGNGTGIQADNFGFVKVSNSSITENTLGLSALTSGQILSRQNNNLDNVTNGSFTGTYGPS